MEPGAGAFFRGKSQNLSFTNKDEGLGFVTKQTGRFREENRENERREMGFKIELEVL